MPGFENIVMRKIFVSGQRSWKGWSRLNNEELHDLHCLTNTRYSGDHINKIVMDYSCGTAGEVERTLQGFGGEMCKRENIWQMYAYVG